VQILKEALRNSSLLWQDLLYTALSTALTYRDSDRKGGANGARIRLNPLKNWEVHHPEGLKVVLDGLQKIKEDFDAKNSSQNKRVSLADLIVLGGIVALEEAIKKRVGKILTISFVPGRRDALQEMLDASFWANLESTFCGFRNYIPRRELHQKIKLEELLVDKAQLLRLTVQELVCLYGGLRVLGINYGFKEYGVFYRKSRCPFP